MTELEEHKPEIIQPSALESLSRAETDVQIATARRYPRTLSLVKSDMLSYATLDEETAASCFYTLPRGGKTIQGPSVRLAEIAIACYGNIKIGARVLSVDAESDNPHVIVQAVCHDMQRNVSVSIEKRRRITKKRSKTFVDEDDIQLACNACSAIAFRDAVFKVVPLALIKPVYEQARKVAVGNIRSLGAKRTEVIDRLKKMGATEDRILAVVEARNLEDIDMDKLQVLIGLGTALKDGETSLEEAFPAPTTSTGAIGRLDPKPADPAQPPPPAAEPTPPPNAEPPPASELKADDLIKQLLKNAAGLNIGRNVLTSKLVEMGLLDDGKNVADMDAKQAGRALDAWDEIKKSVLSPK